MGIFPNFSWYIGKFNYFLIEYCIIILYFYNTENSYDEKTFQISLNTKYHPKRNHQEREIKPIEINHKYIHINTNHHNQIDIIKIWTTETHTIHKKNQTDHPKDTKIKFTGSTSTENSPQKISENSKQRNRRKLHVPKSNPSHAIGARDE